MIIVWTLLLILVVAVVRYFQNMMDWKIDLDNFSFTGYSDMVAKPNTMKEHRLAIFQKLVRKKRRELEELVLKTVEELEQGIYELAYDDTGDRYMFDFEDFGIIKKWERGEINAEEALKSLNDMNVELAAESLLLKRIESYSERFATLKHTIDISIDKTIAEIQKDVVPKTIEHINRMKKFLSEVIESEKGQVKVVYGFVDKTKPPGESLKWQEMTLNQALKFIEANKLKDCDESHVTNKYVVVFNKWYEKTSAVVKETHWFLVPPLYRDTFVELLGIKYAEKVSDEQMAWVDTIKAKKNG